MDRNDLIARLKETEPRLRDFGVAALYLFGSHHATPSEMHSLTIHKTAYRRK